MITIEENIEIFKHDIEEPIRIIAEGSDEHLDLIINITRALENGTEKLAGLNLAVSKAFKTMSNESLEKILPALKDSNRLCLILIGAIRTSVLYSGVRQAVRNFSAQHELLREMIYDLQTIRLPKDDKFDDLLRDINNY